MLTGLTAHGSRLTGLRLTGLQAYGFGADRTRTSHPARLCMDALTVKGLHASPIPEEKPMARRFGFVAAVLAVVSLGAAALPMAQATPPAPVVHEWGTFTSVAGPTGEAAYWQALDGPQDLPCFVERFRYVCIKCMLAARIRM